MLEATNPIKPHPGTIGLSSHHNMDMLLPIYHFSSHHQQGAITPIFFSKHGMKATTSSNSQSHALLHFINGIQGEIQNSKTTYYSPQIIEPINANIA